MHMNTHTFVVAKVMLTLALHEGKGLELFNLQLPAAVTAQVVRIRFTEFTEAPGIHTFHVYAPDNH
jgi:hypothetical protein